MNKKYNFIVFILIFLVVIEISFVLFQFSDLKNVFENKVRYSSQLEQIDDNWLKDKNSYLNLGQFININSEKIRPETTLMPKPLSNPPKMIRAVYLTSWSAGQEAVINRLISLSKESSINAVVIDIKDCSGHIAYKTSSPLVQKYKGEENRIKDINSLIRKLHNNNIYVIARIVVFQDPVLAFSNPKLAIHDRSKFISSNSSSSTISLVQNRKFMATTSTLWFDNAGSPWIDPASREAWKYNLSLAMDAAQRGFDEINFDYVRFPSRGNLDNAVFPFWRNKTSKNAIIKEFYKYLHHSLSNTKISLDIFGMSTVSSNGLGIGQVLEDSFGYFNYICPMLYPSHYSRGFLGYYNPADYPYEVIRYSMNNALNKLLYFEDSFLSTTSSTSLVSSLPATSSISSTLSGSPTASSSSLYLSPLSDSYRNISHHRETQLRPWLQYFDLGAVYNKRMIQLEIKAVQDSLRNKYVGFMLWNPNNIYSKNVLENESQP